MAMVTRRDVVAGVGAVMAANVAGAQMANRPEPMPPPPIQDQTSGELAGGANVFVMSSIPGVKQTNGSVRKMVFDGRLATGEAISAHLSATPAGTPAGAAHKIAHSEFIVVMQGTMEFVHDDKTDRASAGDLIYVAYGTNHQVRNVGDGEARYLVFQVGGDTK